MVKHKNISKKIFTDQDSPNSKRVKDKDGEVAIARGRLAGALKGIVGTLNSHPDGPFVDFDQDSPECVSQSSSSANKTSRDFSPTNRKKHIIKQSELEDNQSYLMKLFDRSVDLAQFDIDTPLYPVCRAWIENQRISQNSSETYSNNRDHDFKFRLVQNNNDCTDVFELPPPKPLPKNVTTHRIPSPEDHLIEEIDLNLDANQVPTMEKLMQSHLQNWADVRKRWRRASQKNDDRYAESRAVLASMFERAQMQFHAP